MTAIFLRLLTHDDKADALAGAVEALRDGRPSPDVFGVEPESFRQVPGSPFAYWVSERVRRLFTELPAFEGNVRNVKVGLQTSDDFRFVRAGWEVAPGSTLDGAYSPDWQETTHAFQAWCRGRTFEGKYWVPFAKGGAFSPFYSDVFLAVNWDDGGREMYAFNGIPFGGSGAPMRNPGYYFRHGLTWPLRSQIGLAFRAMPAGCIFAHKGPAAFVASDGRQELLGMLATVNSAGFRSFVELQMALGSYEVGVIQRTPFPDFTGEQAATLGELARSAVDLKRSVDTANETSHAFHLPALLQVCAATLSEQMANWHGRSEEALRKLDEIQRGIDDLAFLLYGVDGEDRRAMEEGSGLKTALAETVDAEDDEPGDDLGPAVEDKPLTATLLSYAAGCVVGRWDILFATGKRSTPKLPDPFDPLPVCSPGMLQGSDGLPAMEAPEGYPLRIDWDGILVDDPSHSDDIVRRIRDVLEVIWKDRADAIEREACEILGVKELRDYFRKPGNGGFWTDHISRYSKSRRKAPIYWLLQSSKKNYALWIYYHRLDKDILFKALLNYVEPKIRREESRLNELRSQKTALGPAAKGSKKIDKDIDRQESFLTELRDFEEKLRRAANLHLDPDLNDGVVLNIAPLRELVPWKEAKSYWDDLMDGKYEWSSIGKQLRAKGVVQ